jgi:broad specificity phosphatase PhoE
MRPDVTIYFIRHGETEWNAEARYQGQADIPMNARGREQAERNGLSLRPLLPGIAEANYVASPLARARETMQIVRRVLELPPEDFRIDDRLKEAQYGAIPSVGAPRAGKVMRILWRGRCRGSTPSRATPSWCRTAA